ncbi:hypothetical protein PABG_07367 [Paracoccidioides brasiliensis Pb03]|nr:hypothetical protein PABG_07367 [Paracoccidioides brasiliensis Pb03]
MVKGLIRLGFDAQRECGNGDRARRPGCLFRDGMVTGANKTRANQPVVSGYWKNGAGNRGYFLRLRSKTSTFWRPPQSLRPGACLIGYEVPSFIVSNELYQKAKWVRGKRPRKEGTNASHLAQNKRINACPSVTCQKTRAKTTDCLTERPINPENHG